MVIRLASEDGKHLTETEVEKLIEAAKDNRYAHRDAPMILVAYPHGLRASEVCDLRWEQIDFNSATLHVRKVWNGKPSTHPVHCRAGIGPSRHLARRKRTSAFGGKRKLPPEIFEPAWCKLGVAYRRLYRAVPQIALQCSGVSAFVRQYVTGGVAQHMWMDFEGHLSLDAGALDHLLEARDSERCASLADEDERRLGVTLQRS